MKRHRKLKILLIILAVLITFRLALPFIVTRYVNKVLAELPGYTGSIEGVRIHLYRGAYEVRELRIFKVDGHKKIPFVNVPVLDLSVEWKALLDGALVGEVEFERSELNFIGGGSGNQYGEDVDWTKPIKKLMPLKINRLTIRDGKITFFDFTTKPHVDLYLKNVQASASNLSNATDEKTLLPSQVKLTAQSIGDGALNISGRINPLKQLPDLDLDLKFENVNMPALNDFFLAYAKIDVEKGDFDLYTEMTVKDGALDGYVKPMVENLQVVDWEHDKQKPVQLIWESIVGFLAEIFENQPKDRFATRIPMNGNLKDVKTSAWPALWSIFQNAFVKAFEKNTDNTVTLVGSTSKKEENGNKKEEKKKKKEERKKKREERRKEKKEEKEAKENG